MTFKLLKKSTGATLTKFHIVDGRGDIVGSINVANEQASDLQNIGASPALPLLLSVTMPAGSAR